MRTECRHSSGLAAKAFAPASCFPSSLRRVTFSQNRKICEKVRLKPTLPPAAPAFAPADRNWPVEIDVADLSPEERASAPPSIGPLWHSKHCPGNGDSWVL